MRTLSRLTTGVKDAYWEVVHDCLVDLFGVPPQDARRECNDRRAEVEFVPRALKNNVFYHNEPFDVAAGLAARRPQFPQSPPPSWTDPQFKSGYESILKRNGLA